MLELTLHKSLYASGAVHAVAAMYGGVAQVAVDESEHDLVVRFDQVDPDVAEVLLDHFANHVLVETVRTTVQAEQAMTGEAS